MEQESKHDPVKLSEVVKTMSREQKGEYQLMLNNGMADVLGLGGYKNGNSIGPEFFAQISQLDTMFKNNRWALVSNQRQLVSQMYVEHGLVRTVIDVPVEDALRGGIDVTTKQLDEEQLKLLTAHMQANGDLEAYGEGLKWKRTFGGAAIMVLTEQDPSSPLSTKELNEFSDIEFKAIDMWELNNPEHFVNADREVTTATEESEVSDSNSSVPIERLRLSTKNQCFDYYGQKIHKSRIRIMKGVTAPSFIRTRLRGWGLSELEQLVRSINQFLKATDLTFEVLDEFKLDIFKIKGLKEFVGTAEGREAIAMRVAMANQQKNFQNAMSMDSEDDYDHKQLSFTGLADVMTGIRIQVACDMRMPLTKIFGMSATGFNSGEDDIENYNAMVESSIRSKSKPDLMWMTKIRCKELFNFIPTDLDISFKPLRVLGAVDEESVKTQKYQRVLQTWQAGGMTTKEFKDACNKDNLLPIKLDTSVDKLDMLGEEMSEDSPGVEAGRFDDQEKEDEGNPNAKPKPGAKK